jgi:hypothetical protein
MTGDLGRVDEKGIGMLVNALQVHSTPHSTQHPQTPPQQPPAAPPSPGWHASPGTGSG